ncbi:hypothetical protein [Alteribacillus iranensis]|uniref:Uncharacterized protein n=1 Tax=Alteribacillus iranensis TaxID=930128 RepID=A0A1I2BUE8_9BACI|nr:hypothetical protein [Alteribacillus iranensis]SFE59003.1 hypothetical protein SAMN05192532_102480 [Alteribacillus iranensis]
MTVVNWIVLTLYILIPSAICFGVIIGIWKLITFFVWKFQQFMKRNDGLDYVERQDQGRRPRQNKSRPRSLKEEFEDGIPIGAKTTHFTGNVDPKTGKVVNGKYSEQEVSMTPEEIRKLSEKLRRQSR